MATKYTHRFLARLIIEAKTPLAVGSGNKDIMTDALIATDVNGLPYIPGTAIAGVLRHMINAANPQRNNLGQTMADIIFGYQETDEQKKERIKNTRNDQNEDYSKGSEIIITAAKILNSKSEVIDGLNVNAFDDDILMHYQTLPIRQHVRINAKGSADVDNHGKFDNQVCYAGTRFCFEIEMVAANKVTENFDKVLNTMKNKTFRLGSGTRNGLGDIEVVDLQTKTLDLANGGLDEYLKKTSNLNSDFWKKNSKNQSPKDFLPQNYEEIKFTMKAKDFFLFGSGFGDTEADITPVFEAKVDWTSGIGKFVENMVLIPATSLKGALSHRVAYHWNRLNKIFIGDDNYKLVAGGDIVNPAVKVLFGYASQDEKVQKRGNLIFSDIVQDKIDEKQNVNTQVHVSIDRFTGGAKVKSGALFTEKNVYGEGMDFTVNIFKDNDNIKRYAQDVFNSLPESVKANGEAKFLETVNQAFDAAINDLKKGMLPLGGGTSRGNGIFVES